MHRSKTISQNSTSSYKACCIRLLFASVLLITICSFYIIFSRKSFLYLANIKIQKNDVTTIEKPTFQLQSPSNSCIVYPRDNAGALGNTMFLVATVYGLARLHSCHIYLTSEIIAKCMSAFIFDLSPFLISESTFNSIINDTSKMTRNITRRSVVCEYIPELTRPNAIPKGTIFEIQGYWQSYLHFAKYGNDIRERIFAPTQQVTKNVSNFFINIYQKKFGLKTQFSVENHQSFKKHLAQSNQATWIGIHIRRSDFVQHNYSSTDQYLFTAIEYYTSYYSNAHFIVASDDKPYCERIFSNRSNIFLTPQSFFRHDDMAALSLCQHSIITGGTFGWWIAFLTNGKVVHDKVYPSGCQRREYYYPPWFLIDGNVRQNKDTDYIL